MSGPVLFVVQKEMDIIRPFVVKVHRTEDEIIVQYVRRCLVQGELRDFYICGFHCKRKLLMLRADWKEGTQYGVHFKSYDISFMHACNKLIEEHVQNGLSYEDVLASVRSIYPRYGTINRNGYFINISAATQNGRVSALEGHALIPAYRMLNFTLKFKDSKFTEIMVSMNIDGNCELEVSSGDEVLIVSNSTEIYCKLSADREDIKNLVWRPKLKIGHRYTNDEARDLAKLQQYENIPESVNAVCKVDKSVHLCLQLMREWYGDEFEHEAEIYLEAVNGYLPKNRIYLDSSGCAYFKMMALGLEVGDIMRVKAGFRYQTGIAEFTILVTD